MIFNLSASSNRYVIGGDEESRTPVHNTFHIDFYKFSLLFKFDFTFLTNKIRKTIAL